MSEAEPARAAGRERVEVLDGDGRVTEVVERSQVRRRNLRHRAVFVAVVDPAGERLLVHQRAPWKDVWPDRWDLAFGGIVGVGESWDEAVCRELAEETGVVVDRERLRPLGQGAYDDDEVRVLGRAYLVASDGPFTFPDGEVVATAWVSLATLTGWVADRLSRDGLCPDSVAIVLPPLAGRDRTFR